MSTWSKDRKNLLKDYTEEEQKIIDNGELLETEVDVLIPAAMENMINEDNADRIKVWLSWEAANGPVTKEADEILEKWESPSCRISWQMPAELSFPILNGYRNTQAFCWTEDQVIYQLKSMMDDAFESVWSIAKDNNVTLRTGAYLIAVKRVVEAQNGRADSMSDDGSS